jgi:hypothetical protein
MHAVERASRKAQMNRPKRHHWWPQVQSQHWTLSDGLVHVVKADGTSFRAKPINVGVESELYTFIGQDGEKRSDVEEWLAKSIDAPAGNLISYLHDPDNYRTMRRSIHPRQRKAAAQVGVTLDKAGMEILRLPDEVRYSIASYLAAMIVRNPKYIAKMVEYHRAQKVRDDNTKQISLINMISVYETYREALLEAILFISRRGGTNEFLFGDCGVAVREPWKNGLMPFDLNAPITPDLMISVLPLPFDDDRRQAFVGTLNNQGISMSNRMVVGSSTRFVYSRQPPPIGFISGNMGIPAMHDVGYRWVDGHFETSLSGITVRTPARLKH